MNRCNLVTNTTRELNESNETARREVKYKNLPTPWKLEKGVAQIRSKSTYAFSPRRLSRPRVFQQPAVAGFPVSDSPFVTHTKTMSSENQDRDTNQ